jgi:hypothetical protein
MAKQFSKNFIPKKAVAPLPTKVKKTKKPMGILMIIAIFVAVLTAVVFVAVALYRAGVHSGISEKYATITAVREMLDEELLGDMRSFGSRLSSAMTLMDGHISATPFFHVLGESTLPGVQYDSLMFIQEESEEEVFIAELSGQASSFFTIAQQSKIFSTIPYLDTHLFSDFVAVEEEQGGGATFSLRIILPKDIIYYTESFNDANQTLYGGFSLDEDDNDDLLFDIEEPPITIPEEIPLEFLN